jgi:TPR repeat protein
MPETVNLAENRAGRAGLAILAAIALAVFLGPGMARAGSVADDWNRVGRSCAGLDKFLKDHPEPRSNPFHGEAQRIRAELKCGKKVDPVPDPTPTPSATATGGRRPPGPGPTATPTSRPTGRPSQPPPQIILRPTNQAIAIQAFDRREYRRALDTFAAACKTDRDGYSCQQTGVMLSKAKDYALGEPNYPLARTYFESACDVQPNASYCNNARLVNSWGHYGTVEPGRAYAYFQRSSMAVGALDCKGSMATTCEVLGRGFIGAGRDVVTSSILFNMACDGGDARGCYQAGTYAVLGLGRTATVQDHLRAEAYFRRACDGKVVEACDRGIAMRASATFGILDPGRARQFFASLGRSTIAVDCRTPTNEVCYNLGLAFTMAQYGTPQPYVADAFFDRACDVDHPVACRMVGIRLQTARNHVRAAEKFVRGCKGNDGHSRSEAQGLMQRACTLGISEGCGFRDRQGGF